MLYSIVETARASNLNPYKYFDLLLTEIPKHIEDTNKKLIDDLLPWSHLVKNECESLIKKIIFKNQKIYDRLNF